MTRNKWTDARIDPEEAKEREREREEEHNIFDRNAIHWKPFTVHWTTNNMPKILADNLFQYARVAHFISYFFSFGRKISLHIFHFIPFSHFGPAIISHFLCASFSKHHFEYGEQSIEFGFYALAYEMRVSSSELWCQKARSVCRMWCLHMSGTECKVDVPLRFSFSVAFSLLLLLQLSLVLLVLFH